jgi:choline dehydrogenase-like flavoprotein
MRFSASDLKECILRIVKWLSEKSLQIICRITPNNSKKRLSERARRCERRPGKGYLWFTKDEADLLELLAALIVPSEESTPGANEMEVLGPSLSKVVDTWASASEESKSIYSEGLIAIDGLANNRYQTGFSKLEPSQRLDLLKSLSISTHIGKKRKSPSKMFRDYLLLLRTAWAGAFPGIKLFPILRRDVLTAFYTSQVSWIWLDYDGPPMPHGYPDLNNKRPQKPAPLSSAVRELADSGFVSPAPNSNLKITNPDAIVIGSGAGGAVIAKELAEAGLSVTVIEAGRRFNPFSDYLTDRTDFEVVAKKVFDDPAKETRDIYTYTGRDWFCYDRAKGVGGSTLKYMACSPRFHESDFRTYSEDGLAMNWPISYNDLEPFYCQVEYELGVAGPVGSEANPFEPPRSKPYPTPAHQFNLASLAIKRGADKLGFHLVREPLAIPTVEWEGRPACTNAGVCNMGCASTAKSSMDMTYLRKAERSGRVEIRPNCMAFRITMAPDGRARGVAYFDNEGKENEIRARVIIIAGNAVETPRLLLQSESSRYPEGLANSSGLVGKFFMEHLAVSAYGLFSERLDAWRGTPTGGFIQDSYATNKMNAFARGWTTYVNTTRNWPLAIAQKVPGWGISHKHRTQQLFGHHIGLVTVGEQLPNIENRVDLDPTIKDSFGLSAPRLTNSLGSNDKAMIRAIKANLKEILEAAGATEILEIEFIPGWSSHYLGTCRMGTDPRDSIVNQWGRTHDIPNLYIADGSIFVTGAAVNPALTISALAVRISAGIIDSFKQGDL